MGDERGETPAMGEGGEQKSAYNAGASAPSAPPGAGFGDREVGLGASLVSVPPDDVDHVLEAAAPVTSLRGAPAAKSAGPSSLTPLKTNDGRVVSVVHIVAELAPFARTGGLGEAVKSLAEFQSASGIPTAIIMPLYRQVHSVAPNLEQVGEPFTVQLGPQQEQARLWQITPDRRVRGRPRVYFVDHPHFFDRPGLYGENGYDYPDNPRRYAFFSLAALTAVQRIAPNAPVIMHAHDWHAA
ncbi:MAG: glycogen/starch synthase [Gemmatimonadetes bacterium]|nr:glycogen/starch synthase [Gemmatimonadota bacterium]